MKNPLRSVADTIAPRPEVLWERGGATMQTIEIDPGRYAEVPFFDLEIIKRCNKTIEPLQDNLKRVIGEIITQTYITSDGIDRAVRIFQPYECRDDFTVAMTTPWFTSHDGMNSAHAETMAAELNAAVILVGAEHSSRRGNWLTEVGRLPGTIRRSRTISLAKTAQSDQLITADICQEYNLPTDIVKTGESRGAMVTDGEYVYADYYGLRIVYQDKTALCIPDRLFSEDSESGKLVQFPAMELGGIAVVGASAIAKNTVDDFFGTLNMNPNFMTSSIIGVGPALASGEAGRFVDWLPLEAAGHQVTYDFDTASRPERQRQLYRNHKNIAIITLRGTHGTLAHTETLRHGIDRIDAFGNEYELCRGALDKVNWHNVHLKDDDKYRTMT